MLSCQIIVFLISRQTGYKASPLEVLQQQIKLERYLKNVHLALMSWRFGIVPQSQTPFVSRFAFNNYDVNEKLIQVSTGQTGNGRMFSHIHIRLTLKCFNFYLGLMNLPHDILAVHKFYHM